MIKYMIKIKKFLITLIIIVSIAIAFFYVYQKSTYTLDEVCAMLNTTSFPNNIYVKVDILVGSDDTYSETTNFYIKDNLEYISMSNGENEELYNLEDNTYVSIDHTNKVISMSNDIVAPNPNNSLKSDFFSSVLENQTFPQKGIYKYCGKTIIDGKKCIKISMTNNFEIYTDINYYYIDLETTYIVKHEFYNENEKKYTEVLSYEENRVTDLDIPKFDINNYPDYELISN